MKKELLYRFLAISLLFISYTGYSQINYTENFESDDINWSNDDDAFWVDDFESCDGYSLATELYTYYDEAVTVSGSLGVSNGQLVTLSYQYKLVDYYEYFPQPNTPDWGSFTIEYATSPSGPWTVIQTVNPANHIVSGSCATKTATFTPAGGSNLYLRLRAQANQDEDAAIDAILFIDNVSVTQGASLPCEGTPAASATVAASTSLCNSQSASLSLTPAYYAAGLTYQWQTSQDNITYTNVGIGGTASTYTAAQAASTWYRAIITCTASGLSATSTPIQVINTGLECYCDVAFENDVEPITLVEFAGINNSSSAIINGSPAVENFTSLTPGQVSPGETYDITLKGNTNDPDDDGYETYFTVFIDWNHDGDLTDDNESYEIGFITNSTGTDGVVLNGEIEVPESAMPGITYMRVFKLYDNFTSDPCSSEDGSGYGQVENYLLFVGCNVPAPVFDDSQINLCNAATGADLPTTNGIVWYGSATGDDVIPEDATITSGVYYAAQVVGTCESATRTPVTINIDTVTVVTMDDVYSCDTYVLPVLATGSRYYTELGGTGIVYDGGDIITETTMLYIYASSATVTGCYAQSFFTVYVNTLQDIQGQNAQNIPATGATIQDIVIITQDGATVTWYASEADAIAGNNPLPEDTVLQNNMIYYAVQSTEGGCTSAVFPVTVTTLLGLGDITKSGFTVYPNPLKDVLTVSYNTNIDSVKVYNMLGQEVYARATNQNEVKADLSNLAAGNYLVKVTAGDASSTIKIIKQ